MGWYSFPENIPDFWYDRTAQLSWNVGIELHSLGPLVQHSLHSVKSQIDLIGDSENLVDGYLICVPRTTIYVLVNAYAVEGV